MKTVNKRSLEEVLQAFSAAVKRHATENGVLYAYCCGEKILSISIEEIDFNANTNGKEKETEKGE